MQRISGVTIAAAVIVLVMAVAGCGGGSGSSSSSGSRTTTARAELQAEVRSWGEKSLDALQAGRSAVTEHDITTAHRELEAAHHDVQEAKRAKSELGSKGAEE
jgi:hypothetical protein